jgi:hypothetical protein
MKRTIIMIALILLLVGLGSSPFFYRSKPDTQKLQANKHRIIQDQTQFNLIDRNYNRSMTVFTKRSDSLLDALNETQGKLKIAKAKLTRSETTLIRLAKKDTVQETLSEQVSDCDLLKEQVLAFTGILDSTRNLYECNITQLQNTLAVRDSEMVECNAAYLQMKDLMKENLERERQLGEELQTAYKQQRKKALHTKVWAGGFLILSGIAAGLFLNAQQ